MTPEDEDCSATTSADYCNEDDGDDDYSDDEFCILDHPQKEQEVNLWNFFFELIII